MIQVHRVFHFEATHAYGRTDWSLEANAKAFGELIHPHPHTFRVEVVVSGRPDPVDGFVVDLPALDHLLEEQLRKPLAGTHLNEAIAELRAGRLQPSTEMLVGWMADRLLQTLPPSLTLIRLTVWESESLGSSFVPESVQGVSE